MGSFFILCIPWIIFLLKEFTTRELLRHAKEAEDLPLVREKQGEDPIHSLLSFNVIVYLLLVS